MAKDGAHMLPLSVPLGSGRAGLDPARALAARIRMVLETRPGDVPFRPDFGCDLAAFSGQPCTQRLTEQVRVVIEDALTRHIPDLRIRRCEVRARTSLGSAPGHGRDVPLAEAALVRLGVQATLEVRLDVSSRFGDLQVSQALNP